MIFRYDKKRNPRLKVLKLVVAVLALITLVAVAVAPPLIALPVFVIAAVLLIKVWGVYRNLIDSYINVHDEGLSGKAPSGKMIRMLYSDVAESGVAIDENERKNLFLYNANQDQLIQIPDLYENFDEMTEEVRQHCTLRHLRLQDGQSLEEALKNGFPATGGDSV